MDKRRRIICVILALLPVPTFFFSLFLGTYCIPMKDIIFILYSKLLYPSVGSPWPDTYEIVLFHVRLPRIILALLVGIALATSGVSLQAVLRNPLVSPYILGLSSGAAFGATLALAFLPSASLVQILAFIFGLFAVFVAYGIARVHGQTPIVSLVLAGVIVGAFFSALVSVIEFLVEPEKLAGIVYWIMGGLYLADWSDVYTVTPVIASGTIILFLMRWRLNVLSMGEEEAKAMGLNAERDKAIIITAATLVTASAVSVSGIIGWVGLIIPHMVRILVGPDHRKLIPLSATFGASFLLLCDDIARTLLTYEIPIGVITTLTGAPFFAYLLKKYKGGGWS